MINKDKDQNTVVQFGYGTVHLFAGIIDEQLPFMGMRNGTPLPVGKPISKEHYPDLKNVFPEVYLSFASIKSLDVFIKELQNLKQHAQINNLIP